MSRSDAAAPEGSLRLPATAPEGALPPWALRRVRGAKPSVVLGAMNFGRRTPEREAFAIVRRAYERGVRLFDTANAYGDGESERILGRALSDLPDAEIATKVGFGRVSGRPEGLGADRIAVAIDESLSRLGRDRVALYYLHVPDARTPIVESLEAMATLSRSGKVGAFGVSNYASWQIVEMFAECDRRGFRRPVIAQQIHNLLIRQLELEYSRFAHAFGLHTTIYNPLAGGLLAGQHLGAPGMGGLPAPPKGSRFDGNKLYLGRYWSATMHGLAAKYAALAAESGLTLVELSYRWLARRDVVDSILVGPGSLQHLDAALDALQGELPADVEARADAIHAEHVGTETTYAR